MCPFWQNICSIFFHKDKFCSFGIFPLPFSFLLIKKYDPLFPPRGKKKKKREENKKKKDSKRKSKEKVNKKEILLKPREIKNLGPEPQLFKVV